MGFRASVFISSGRNNTEMISALKICLFCFLFQDLCSIRAKLTKLHLILRTISLYVLGEKN